MLARIGIGLLWAAGGYLLAVLAGYFLIMQLSRNTHDRSMEAGMTAFFFIGPVVAIIVFLIRFFRHKA